MQFSVKPHQEQLRRKIPPLLHKLFAYINVPHILTHKTHTVAFQSTYQEQPHIHPRQDSIAKPISIGFSAVPHPLLHHSISQNTKSVTPLPPRKFASATSACAVEVVHYKINFKFDEALRRHVPSKDKYACERD
jgi:hypothetical protein